MFNLINFKNTLNTKSFGNVIRYYPELKSTNTKAWELISINSENGTAVITDNQQSGRGRRSNKWFSIPNKGLTFSIILYPKVLPNQINIFSLITGLAVADCLKEYNIRAELKWPNDVLIGRKKVGGMLCESKISSGMVQSMVIGVGLNINNEIKHFPLDIQSTATSLLIESGTQYQIEKILAKILNHLEKRLNKIDSLQLHIQDWERHCAHLNKEVLFNSGRKAVEGTFKGLTNTGQAIINIDGIETIFDSGEITSP